MEQDILNILAGINPYIEISSKTRLLEEEVLDSTGILLLITELEQKFNIDIPFEKIRIEDFETLSSIVQFVKTLF